MRPSCDGPVSSSSRKDEEQQKLKQLQEQEQARALVATLQMVNMFLCYYAQRLYPQTHGTSPTSVSGFNNTTITGDVNISNTITNSDGTEGEPSITKCRIADLTIFSTSSENTFWRKGAWGHPASPFHENLSFRSCMWIRNRPHGSLPHLRHKFPHLLSMRTAGTVPG